MGEDVSAVETQETAFNNKRHGVGYTMPFFFSSSISMKISTTTWTLKQNGGKAQQFILTLRPVRGAPSAKGKKKAPAPAKKAPPAPKKPPAPKSKKEDAYDSDDSFFASETYEDEALEAVREARRVAGEFGAGGSAARKASIAAASAPTVSFGFSKPTSSAAPTILVPRRKK